MTSLFNSAVSYLSKALGIESLSAFPAGHKHARTRWDPSYFDIAYGTAPESIERAICTAIANTPTIFVHVYNPTPRMQATLLAAIDESLRRRDGNEAELAGLLIAAYDSGSYTQEAVPGLRAVIAGTLRDQEHERARSVLGFLAGMPVPYGVLDAQ